MNLFYQVALGTVLLGASCILHILALFACLPLLKSTAQHSWITKKKFKEILLVGMMIAAILASHGFQIWLWAAVWLALGAFVEMQEALYFSAVTYTTLGYGDIVLGPSIRLFSTFSAVSGLLSFGVSIVLLVGLVSRLLPDDITGD